jgi:uncharacterized membrane protein
MTRFGIREATVEGMTTLLTDHWHHGGGAWWFLAPIFWISVWILIIVAV